MLPVFAVGMIIYYAYEKVVQDNSIPPGFGAVLIFAGLFGWTALLDGRLKVFVDDTHWQAILYGFILLGLAILPVGLIVNRFTRWYGELSYSLYLNHPTIVFFLIPIYRVIYDIQMPLTLSLGVCFLLTLLLVTICSYATYHLIEKPGMRIGSWLFKRFVLSVPKGSNCRQVTTD